MKKIFVIIAVIFLTACGNSGASGGLEDFDHSRLKEELEEEAFQPQLPAKTPFEVTETQVTHPPNQDTVLMIDFMSYRDDNKIKNSMSLMAVNVKSVDDAILKFEEVKIGDITGKYTVNDAGAIILKWNKEGIAYNLTFYGGKVSEAEVTKEELILTAESFE
ncbi:DUF4367 domain-containing protein [Bacillus sp. P14.5]|uniref:DUF4367 domain-containing protein n=1 Tax=Bacillus sp. P14.5 TaxID=1983400 RepID=UPI000DEAE405|nr:DUF4367 domain-containing protein [Bacillus sp. P14.5]